MDLTVANKRVRDIRRQRKPPQPALQGDIQIIHSDFRSMDIEPGTVDMIFTDPPYAREYLDLYSDLSHFAAKALKPGGILMAYAGTLYLDEIFRRLGEHLQYSWLCVLLNTTCAIRNYQRGFFGGYRLLLIYTNGPSHSYKHGRVEKCNSEYANDVFLGRSKDKSLHAWQQSPDEAVYYISKLTEPGAFIVDCFGGTFTTGEAAYRVGGGRRFCGCDIDPQCVAIGRERLSALMAESPKQLDAAPARKA